LSAIFQGDKEYPSIQSTNTSHNVPSFQWCDMLLAKKEYVNGI